MEQMGDPEKQPEEAEEAAGEAEEETEGGDEEEVPEPVAAAPNAEATQAQPADQAAAPKASAPEPAKPKGEELKVVILVNGDSVMLGVIKPDCDPIFKNFTGDLAAALQQVPAFVGEARQKWAVSPRYPKAPEPPPAATTTVAAPARTPAPDKPKAQPSFF